MAKPNVKIIPSRTPPTRKELNSLRNRRSSRSLPTKRDLEILLWGLKKCSGNNSATAVLLAMNVSTLKRWKQYATNGITKETVESQSWTKEKLIAEYKRVQEKLGNEVTHPSWQQHSEAGGTFYKFWGSWNVFRSAALGKTIGKNERSDTMTLEQAKQLLKVYESQGCVGIATAVALGQNYNSIKHRLQMAKMLTKWEKPSKPVPNEDEGLDRSLTNKLFQKLKEAKSMGQYNVVITSAQNNTPVHEAGFKTLKTYCRERRAILVVIPYRYKNPTSHWSKAAKEADQWHHTLLPHLLDRRINLNDNLTLMGDIKTQPTAVSPLAGYETISRASSAILGHPKLELTTIATPQNKLPKILTTTGSITVKNYTNSNAGKKGDHHHTFGACVVEIRGNKVFHMRQLNMLDNGSFMDLDKEYDGDDVRPVGRAAALDMGDTHVEVIDPNVVEATFGKGGIVEKLNPEVLVWHDVHDFYAGNHWHKNNPFIKYVKHHQGRANVQKWLFDTFDFVNVHTPPKTQNVFVNSNHPNNHFLRWVMETDPREDPENCLFWAETFKAICESGKWTRSGVTHADPFIYWGRKMLPKENNIFLGPQQGYMIKNIEVGYHGDYGPGGSRGNRVQFGKIGTKVIIGHGHSPGIRDGAYQVGTSSMLDLKYVRGPSSWLHTHCVIYQNGKRSLINIIDGNWHG